MRRVLIAGAAAIALVLAAAGPAAAQTGQATASSFVAWDQVDVVDVAEAQARQFRIKVDGGAPQLLAHKCGAPAADAVAGTKATCAASLPAMTPGNHTLAINAADVVDGVVLEGEFSDPFPVRMHVAPGKPVNVRLTKTSP